MSKTDKSRNMAINMLLRYVEVNEDSAECIESGCHQVVSNRREPWCRGLLFEVLVL